jgi:uncharacterized protein (UPF0335 family)
MPRALPAYLLSLVITSGCGHRATEAECEVIIERIARLELEKRKVSGPAIEAEVEAAKRALKETTMRDCVGKRITKDAMKCVENAESSQQIVDDCFD